MCTLHVKHSANATPEPRRPPAPLTCRAAPPRRPQRRLCHRAAADLVDGRQAVGVEQQVVELGDGLGGWGWGFWGWRLMRVD
jgi:hypothetical protein